MIRASAYRTKPTEGWNLLMNDLSNITLMLVARSGPSVFNVKDEEGGIFRVVLGNPHKCTCGSPTQNPDGCCHILFCLTKVLRVPKEHSLCFQTSLTDNEMNQVLDGSYYGASRQAQTIRRPFLRRDSSPSPAASREGNNSSASLGNTTEDTAASKRQLLSSNEEDNACPICQDCMTSDQPLTWCRDGCGQNKHAKCMYSYAQFQIQNKKPLNCPLCRVEYDMKTIRDDMKEYSKEVKSNTLKLIPVACTSCKCILRGGTFYRCIECSQQNCRNHTLYNNLNDNSKSLNQSQLYYDYCNTCYTHSINPIHRKHHFVSSDATTSLLTIELNWNVVKNPIALAAPVTQQRDSAQEEVLRTIAERELDMNDYELLLNLDNSNNVVLPSLAMTCVLSLPKYKHNDGLSTGSSNGGSSSNHSVAVNSGERLQCWCCTTSSNTISTISHHSNSGSNSSSHQLSRVLPCGHVAHDKCIEEDLSVIILSNHSSSDGHGMSNNSAGVAQNEDISQYRCNHANCGSLVFPGLNRKKRRKRNNPPTAEVVPGSSTDGNVANHAGSVAGGIIYNGSNSGNGSSGSSGGINSLGMGLIGSGIGIAGLGNSGGSIANSGAGGSVMRGSLRRLSNTNSSSNGTSNSQQLGQYTNSMATLNTRNMLISGNSDGGNSISGNSSNSNSNSNGAPLGVMTSRSFHNGTTTSDNNNSNSNRHSDRSKRNRGVNVNSNARIDPMVHRLSSTNMELSSSGFLSPQVTSLGGGSDSHQGSGILDPNGSSGGANRLPVPHLVGNKPPPSKRVSRLRALSSSSGGSNHSGGDRGGIANGNGAIVSSSSDYAITNIDSMLTVNPIVTPKNTTYSQSSNNHTSSTGNLNLTMNDLNHSVSGSSVLALEPPPPDPTRSPKTRISAILSNRLRTHSNDSVLSNNTNSNNNSGGNNGVSGSNLSSGGGGAVDLSSAVVNMTISGTTSNTSASNSSAPSISTLRRQRSVPTVHNSSTPPVAVETGVSNSTGTNRETNVATLGSLLSVNSNAQSNNISGGSSGGAVRFSEFRSNTNIPSTSVKRPGRLAKGTTGISTHNRSVNGGDDVDV